ncbi:MAG TPA: discoidin domain-containing protein [Paenibacillus sp.]|jgi:fibronectin type 3 domain-containing protein
MDNGPLLSSVKDRIKDMNARVDSARPYVYPKFVNSNLKDFYQYVDTKFSDSIPVYKGTIENWWNYGIPSDAYSESVQRYAQDNVPAAETFATFANQASTNSRYPYQKIWNAYNNLNLYDEHTFGGMSPAIDNTHIWKRNNALTARNLSDSVMNDSLASLNNLIPTTGKTIAVYNSLSWTRSDLVKVKLSDLPAHFELTDIETSAVLKYDKLSDGFIEFLAPNVPGLGYKTFLVTEKAKEPVFKSTLKKSDNTMENQFFKVTFGGQGEITSIIDKQNGNAEMVDPKSPHKMNEFVYDKSYRDDFELKSESKIYDASVSINIGATRGQMTSNGFSEGTAGVQRNVILYESVPKIDIVNVVNKIDAPGSVDSVDEEAFFTFPLNMPNFTLRSEMPSGDFKPYVDSNINNPDNEQYYTSSTDFYTVHRWIDATNASGNYGITLFPQSAPVVQYGSRRTLKYDIDYNTPKPWIFSYVYGNKWGTNFIRTQPGPTTFKYTLMSHTGKDWRAGDADKYGWQSTTPLQAKVITGEQSGTGLHGTKGQFVNVSADNVVLTTAKPAEANGEGTILRFNETKGADTTVTIDLSYFNPTSVTETDLLENDREVMSLADGKVTFKIDGYGYKTIRLKYGAAPAQVTGVTATMDKLGTLVEWTDLTDTKLAAYEVFRSTNSSFTPGTGNYLGTTSTNSYYDKQVVNGLANKYYYKVRAVRGGLKGMPSAFTTATSGTIKDAPAPTAPSNLSIDYAFGNRVSISWDPSADQLTVKGYKIYKDGNQMADVAATLNSYLDISVLAGKTYRYTVKAYDQAGNLSASSNAVSATTAKGAQNPGNIAPKANVTASSQFSNNFPATAVTDGLVGNTGEWASSNEQNPWVQLAWPSAVTIDRVVMYDRANLTDNVNGGTLTFSDGTSITGIEGIPQDDGGKVIIFPPKEVTWVKFQAVGGIGPNVGLSEIEVFTTTKPVNIASGAKVTSSSQYSSAYAKELAVDNMIRVKDYGEWSSAGEENPWIQLNWPSAKSISQIVLYDRPNLLDNVNGGTLSFSDGSKLKVTGIPVDGMPHPITFPSKSVTWVKFQTAGGKGVNVGLSEIQVYAANVPDLASSAVVTASSEYILSKSSEYALSRAFLKENVIDNTIGPGAGEWASNELDPWIQLKWLSPKTIGKITLYDRPNLTDNANGGILTFSDGSSLNVAGIPADGSPLILTFPSKSITWVKFRVVGGTGSHVGLSEITID